MQKDEVAEVKWISVQDLIEWVNKNPDDFTPSFPKGSLNNIKEIYEKIKNETKS